MTPTRVETRQCTRQIMEINTSNPWITSWFIDTKNDIETLETSRRLANQ